MARLQTVDQEYIDLGELILPTKGLDWPAIELCVCFANTVETREEPSRVHRRSHLGLVTKPLQGYDDIVRWMGSLEFLSDAEVRRLLQISGEYPPPAIEAAGELREIRTLFVRMVNDLADKKLPSEADRVRVRDMVNEYWRPLSFELDGKGAVWTCDPPPLTLERPRRQLAYSMARLLMGQARNRVGRCAAEDCGLLFLYGKPGPSRTWCHKDVCGEKRRKRPPREFH